MFGRTILRHLALGIFFGFLVPGLALAQGASVSLGVKNHDSSIPVEITSENLELNQEAGTASFTGNVFVRQGDMTMTCGSMTVEYGPNAATGEDEIKNIRMFGGVTFASPSEAAESESAIYALTSELLIMSGNVLVTQGSTALSSNKLTYNLQSGKGVMEGNVKTVLQRGSN